MDTRYLKTLVATVESGSFSKAAVNLNITQSAVSQRIKALEDQFGRQLLNRSGPELVLTPAGQVVLAKAREILRKERELADGLKGLVTPQRLSLCCTPTFGKAFLSPVLNEFIRAHAEISDLKFVIMQPVKALDELRNEMFDLAVIEHRPEQDFTGLTRYILPDDEMIFVVAAGKQPTVSGESISLADIARYRLFARRDGCSSKEVLRQILRQLGGDLSIFESIVVSDDLYFNIQSVCEGRGIAFLSKALVRNQLESGELVGFIIGGVSYRRGRSALLLSGRQHDLLLNDLLECVFRVVMPGERPQLITAGRS